MVQSVPGLASKLNIEPNGEIFDVSTENDRASPNVKTPSLSRILFCSRYDAPRTLFFLCYFWSSIPVGTRRKQNGHCTEGASSSISGDVHSRHLRLGCFSRERSRPRSGPHRVGWTQDKTSGFTIGDARSCFDVSVNLTLKPMVEFLTSTQKNDGASPNVKTP